MKKIDLSGLRAGGNPQPTSTDGSCFGSGPRRTPLVVLEKLPEDIAGLVKELQSAVEEYERLVSETKTNIEKAEDARFAAEKVRAKAEELRIAAEEERAASEAARQSAYELIASALTAAENDRVAAETLRESAEALRQSTFETNEKIRAAAHTSQMQSQATAYTNAEAYRNGAYQEAEEDRDGIFNLKEATRDAANQAALGCAETLAALGLKVEQNETNIGNLQQAVDAIEPIVINGDVTNAPDEEDVTTDENNLLKLKDRATAVNQKGYKILRKGVALASQMTETNTIYEVRYAFDLNGGTLNVPSGCILKFNGGKLINGTLNCNDTIIQSESDSVIFDGILFAGTIISRFLMSWVKLVQSYSPNNIAVLASVGNSVSAEIVWNVPEIYITWDAGTNAVAIPIKKGVNDFGGTHFKVKNVSGVNYQYLLVYNATATSLEDTTLSDAINNAVFQNKMGCIVATDETPFVDRTSSGVTSHQYRKDLVLVNNNEALNEPIAPYDDGETSFSGSYFLVDYDGIVVKNIKITRNGEGAENKRIVFARNAFNLTIENVAVFAEETTLASDSIIELSNIYGLILKNVSAYHKINSSTSNYIFTFDNIFGLVIEGFKANSTEWGVINGNNINKASVRDSIFYRFDCHAYSKDFYFEQVSFLNDGVQAGCHFGTIVCESCTFNRGAIHGESTYNCSPYVEYIYNDCTFDSLFVFSGGLNTADLFSATRRAVLDGLYYPVLKIRNAIVKNTTKFCLYQRANPSEAMAAKLKNHPLAVVDGIHVENDGDFLFLICERAISDAEVIIRNMTQKSYNSGGSTTISGFTLANPELSTYKATKSKVLIDGGKIDALALYRDAPLDTDLVCQNAVIIYPSVSYVNPRAVIRNCKVLLKLTSTTYRYPQVLFERCELTGDEGEHLVVRATSTFELHRRYCLVTYPASSFSGATSADESVLAKLDFWERNGNITIFNVPSLTSTEITTLTGDFRPDFKAYNTTANKMTEYIYGVEVVRRGTTANRPTLTASALLRGFQYYDTDLKKYIIWNGTAWTNIDGSALS